MYKFLEKKFFILMHVNYTQYLLNAAECCGSTRALFAVCKDKDDIVFAAETRVVLNPIKPTIADVMILNTLTYNRCRTMIELSNNFNVFYI